jgi:NNP family nitrate/nitrite transporter-like MFS transporter
MPVICAGEEVPSFSAPGPFQLGICCVLGIFPLQSLVIEPKLSHPTQMRSGSQADGISVAYRSPIRDPTSPECIATLCFEVCLSELISQQSIAGRWRVLILSTIAFTLMFNVWLMLGVLSIPIRKELQLSSGQIEWLIATAILSGALLRLHFGIWADRFGGRNTMVALMLTAAIPTYLFSRATTYTELMLCAALFGLAGNSFSVGIAWNSAWFPKESKGTALGIFGAGNVGAAGTKLLVLFVPSVFLLVPAEGYLGGILPGGWRAIPAIYASLLIAMAGIVFIASPQSDPKPASGRSTRELLQPLKQIRVWRFSLYYVVMFGAYVALSGWLPRFYVETYNLPLHTAALLAATFIFPASLLRPLGGYLSDKAGPRVVTYAVLAVIVGASALLCLPWTDLLPPMTAAYTFAAVMFVVGCGMGIGKASVYKYIPNYFPHDVGAVGGLVGALGALGGFFLPVAFGLLQRYTNSPQAACGALFAVSLISLIWLHLTILRLRSSTKQSVEPKWHAPALKTTAVARELEDRGSRTLLNP